MEEVASRSLWKNTPISSPKLIDISLHFTDSQYLKLQNGLMPQQQEDKWFIFFEDNWLYFHRSWTGLGIYKAQLIKEEKGYAIKEFWAERSQVAYKNEDDNHDREVLCLLIAGGLLRVDVSRIYAGKFGQSPTNAIEGWSLFGSLLFAGQGRSNLEKIKAALFGLAVGDALGVPIEFMSREYLKARPLVEMIGYGTYKNEPPGTFSDDSSLTFCLVEELILGYDLKKLADLFIDWFDNKYWTATGSVFDVGIATNAAIDRLKSGIQPELAGGMGEASNGNGSLMRILPLVFYIQDKQIKERFQITKEVSSLTHAHIRSVIGCFYYLEFARLVINGEEKFSIYSKLQQEIPAFLNSLSINPAEISRFDRLLKNNIANLNSDQIQSSGYVIHTLESSIWSLLTTDNYQDAVLKSINLGDDTDTTGAVMGGLAGLVYGYDSIPKKWIDILARHNDIDDLCERFAAGL
jgi:ADP-ribosyl-[dinitrogen reductase] hydrolase